MGTMFVGALAGVLMTLLFGSAYNGVTSLVDVRRRDRSAETARISHAVSDIEYVGLLVHKHLAKPHTTIEELEHIQGQLTLSNEALNHRIDALSQRLKVVEDQIGAAQVRAPGLYQTTGDGH